MRWNIRLLTAGFLYLLMLPVSAWGYGINDYPGSRAYYPYSGPMGVDRQGIRSFAERHDSGWLCRARLA